MPYYIDYKPTNLLFPGIHCNLIPWQMVVSRNTYGIRTDEAHGVKPICESECTFQDSIYKGHGSVAYTCDIAGLIDTSGIVYKTVSYETSNVGQNSAVLILRVDKTIPAGTVIQQMMVNYGGCDAYACTTCKWNPAVIPFRFTVRSTTNVLTIFVAGAMTYRGRSEVDIYCPLI